MHDDEDVEVSEAENVEENEYYKTQYFHFWTEKGAGGEQYAHLKNWVSASNNDNNLTIDCNCGVEVKIFCRDAKESTQKRFDMSRWLQHNKICSSEPKNTLKRKSDRLKLLDSEKEKRLKLENDDKKDDEVFQSKEDDEFETTDEESFDDKIAQGLRDFYSEGIFYFYDKASGK